MLPLNEFATESSEDGDKLLQAEVEGATDGADCAVGLGKDEAETVRLEEKDVAALAVEVVEAAGDPETEAIVVTLHAAVELAAELLLPLPLELSVAQLLGDVLVAAVALPQPLALPAVLALAEGDGAEEAVTIKHEMDRIAWLFPSARKTTSSAVMAMFKGAETRAAVPIPSANPAVPEPATVDTAPVRSAMRRTLWTLNSATNKKPPSGVTATAVASVKAAAVPTPST